MSSPAAGKIGATGVREDGGILPDLKPWREVGWIFRDGETIAIERCDEHTRVRPMTDGESSQSS
jgi:hypothetical protein